MSTKLFLHQVGGPAPTCFVSPEPGRAGVNRVRCQVATANPPTAPARPAGGETSRSAHSERVRRSMRAVAARGFYVFANAPYGYRKVPVLDHGVPRFTLELDPPACNAVRWIFELRLEGASEPEIAAELNAIHIRPPAAGRWRSRDVRRILANRVYCGVSVAPGRDMRDPDSVVHVPDAFPAIIHQHEFNLVQRMP